MTTKMLCQVHPIDEFANLLNSGCLDEVPGFEREFDMYELMGIQWKEQWHSNVLVWMLKNKNYSRRNSFRLYRRNSMALSNSTPMAKFMHTVNSVTVSPVELMLSLIIVVLTPSS